MQPTDRAMDRLYREMVDSVTIARALAAQQADVEALNGYLDGRPTVLQVYAPGKAAWREN